MSKFKLGQTVYFVSKPYNTRIYKGCIEDITENTVKILYKVKNNHKIIILDTCYVADTRDELYERIRKRIDDIANRLMPTIETTTDLLMFPIGLDFDAHNVAAYGAYKAYQTKAKELLGIELPINMKL